MREGGKDEEKEEGREVEREGRMKERREGEKDEQGGVTGRIGGNCWLFAFVFQVKKRWKMMTAVANSHKSRPIRTENNSTEENQT